jgi:membrane-associated protease RseP (regulator of RpoE activity)
MVIGFEMFPRRAQPVLESWVAGNLTVRQLLDESRWESVWKLPAELYLPLFQFARINRIPMVALNVDRQLTRSIAEKGWDAVPLAEREGVGRAAEVSPAYRDFLFEIYGEHPSPHHQDGAKAQKTDDAFGRFVESQTAWDRAMAEALARFAIPGTAGEQPLVVGIMGSGHIRFGHGVPHQLRDLGVKNVGTLLPVPFDFDCTELRPGLADAVFALPQTAKAKAEPPRLGVRLEESAGAVRIADVTSGSLAEATGLKAGDQLVEVAGLPANSMLRVITSVRLQPAGTWLPVRVKRGDDTLELVVKFPAKQ